MINVALTTCQFNSFIKEMGFQPKSQSFLKRVYVDAMSIKDSAEKAGFTTVRGYQLSTQFESGVDKILQSQGSCFILKIEPNPCPTGI